MEKDYKLPAIAWLKMTDYTHGWMQDRLGGGARVGKQRVISIMHLPNAKELLKMETEEDYMEAKKIGITMSGTRRNCIDLGLKLNPDIVKQLYGVTSEDLALYVPVECPKMCLTKNGVLRPWTLDVCFGAKQAIALQRLLKSEFWHSVEMFDKEYAIQLQGKKYPAVDMIEDFCKETETPGEYIDAIRREWQRRVKRMSSSHILPHELHDRCSGT